MPVQGMDVDQVRQMALWLTRMSNDLDEQTHRATSLVQTIVGDAWQGPDAEHFRSDFADQVRPALLRAAQQIEQLAQRARREVQQQEVASQ